MNRHQHLQIGIIWANPYNKNLGVAALAYASLALLHDVVQELGSPASFSFFGSERSGTDKLTIGNRTIAFRNIPGLDFYNWKWRLKLLLNPHKHQLPAIHAIDYVFDVGEGDSFADIYGDVRFQKIRNSKVYFGKRVKKQVLMPQTIGPFKAPNNERVALEAMDYADLIISRDKQSYLYTANHFPENRIAESIDVAFYLPYTPISFDSNRIHVGVNVSGLLWNGGYTKNNQFGMQTDYKQLVLQTIRYFCGQPGVQVHLVSHVIPEHQPVEDDYLAALAIKQEFPQVTVAPRFGSPIEAKNYISGLDFFTGARMHACIAAFAGGVPVYPMAYSRKFNGLFVDTLQYPWLGDCVNQHHETVFDGLCKAFTDRDALRERLISSNLSIIQPRLLELKTLLADTFQHV